MVIRMRFEDNSRHNKPHVHVEYGDYNATIGLDGELLAGSLPAKNLTVMQAWIALREEQLYMAWNNAVRSLPFDKVEPLK
jgi:hypothetical protein